MSLKCPRCDQFFTTSAAFLGHVRSHDRHSTTRSAPPPPSPPGKLMASRNFRDDSVGVFDFASVIDRESNNGGGSVDAHSDEDSFYSDAGYYDNICNDYISEEDSSDDTYHADIDDDSLSDSDYDLFMYVDDDVVECLNDDTCNDHDNEDSPQYVEVPYFTPRHVPDEEIPYSDNIFAPINDFIPPLSFVMQVKLQELFNRNRASLKMYDDMISIINTYIAAPDFNRYVTLQTRNAFLNRVEEVFNTKSFKPTYGSVVLHNNAIATVPVFDMKTMILSILHDTTLMRSENFAEGLDIFTGKMKENCAANECYGEIHTGSKWNKATERIVGTEGKYMPLGLVIFGDKSHTDLHGALSLTPVTFTATFFNKSTRNNPDCWRPMAYIPNLAYGKGGKAKAVDKVQDEHNCLAYSVKSLIELSEAGGIRTTVMGREVIVKPFIHLFIGDTEGHNKWLGHYQGSKPGTSRPYRDCHCSFDDLSSPMPQCTYTKASEFRRAIRLFDDADKKKDGIEMLKQMSRHAISNAMYQTKLPLADNVHGVNKMCPPEVLHVLDAGITMYMMESLRLSLSGGKLMQQLNDFHVMMAYHIKRQSERNMPRGSIRNGIIETTRCQSSERRGNLFLLLCIAHTVDGSQLLKHGLGYTNARWRKWLQLLKLYLALAEWYHDSRLKDEVESARIAVAEVIQGVQRFFPRSEDSHGYNIPKMHGLAKLIDYICEYGSAINFYSGPGEASHKSFVKAPGRKTQRRISEFASQTAGQYYNTLAVSKACKYIDTRLTNEKVSAERMNSIAGTQSQFTMAGKYTLDLYGNNAMRLRSSKKGSELERNGLDPDFVDALRGIANQRNDGYNSGESDNNNNNERFLGYTHVSVANGDGERVNFNAHPFFHGAPWYDWAYVHYVIEDDDGPREEYYPSRIMGFIEDEDDDEVTAIVQCSETPVPWTDLEEQFFVQFKLCTASGSEQQVPLSSLLHPICVVPNYGGDEKYIMILPKGQWSKYFSSFVRKKNGVVP